MIKKNICWLMLVLTTSFTFAQTTIHTNSVTGNDTTGNGSSSAPYKTFHKAYTEASAGDTLNLTGTFTWTDADETGDSSINGYSLSKDISIIGQTATSTIIQASTTSGTADRRVFTIGNINLTVKNITIRNGYLPNAAANKGGAGIHLYRGAVDKTTLFENCIFTENHQTSSYSSSQWYGGGAILVYNTANSPNGTITFKNSVFENNSSDVQGGFLWSYTNSSNPEKIIFNRCTINNNSSGNKQLVYGYYANLEFLNSTLFNNSGRNIISSIYDGNLSIVNSTIYSNNNTSYAVSGSSKDGSYGTHNIYIRNSIIAHNNSNDLDIYNLDSHDVKFNAIEVGRIDYNAMINGVNDNLITSSANLFLDETLKNNSTTGIGKTLKITNSRSVAINNGTNTAVNSISIPTVDQRGASRVSGVDIGSYEYDGPLNADLNSLTISSGILSETFAYSTTTYHATVSATVSSFTVSTTTFDPSASITSDGVSTTGTFSKSYSLTTGTNTITFLVSASDNTATQTYTLLVDREAPSSNTNLTGLTINSGNLSPSFSSGIINYQANVSGMVSAIKVTPTKSDPHTTIKINGSVVSSGSESSDISLITGTNTITINVLAQDGTSSNTYYLIVNKASEFIHIDATNSVSYSGSGNNIYNIADGTLIGTKTSGVTYDSSDGGGLNFNGTSSNITFSNSNTDFGNTFTIVAWVKPETQNDINTLISNAGAGRSTSGFKFHWNNWQTGNGRIVVEANNGVSTLNDNEVCIDGWQQIVWSVDATNRIIKIYKNGVPQNTSGTIDAGVGTSGQWYIGGMSGINYRMKAKLGVLKVFPEVLSDTDIQTEFNKYTSRFTLPTGPTINSFSPSSGNTGTEVTLNGVDFTGATEVLFNNTSATYTVVSDTQIKTTVPSGVSSGTITVKNGCVYGIKSGFEISSLPTPGLAITPNGSVTKFIGETINITPSSSGSGSYTYSSNNTLVATVNNSGVVSVIGEGNATIQVTQLSDGSYAGGTTFLNVNGIKPAAVLSGLSDITKSIGDGSFNVNAISTNNSGPSITYSSSNTSVATINNSSGLITIVGIGNTIITAMQSADSNFSAGQIQMTLTVTLGDSDGDGINDTSDNCPTTPNADQADADGDGVGDVCDNAPNTPNADQADTDGDGTPDVEDNDDDNDGVPDTDDDFPADPNETTDSDGDGTGDNADADNDNDGVLNSLDNCEFTPNSDQLDTDSDGIGNVCDADDDGDGFSDTDEIACGSDPLLASSLPADADSDGIPDCIDADDDNDGFSDTEEATCGSDPLDATSMPLDTDTDGTPNCIDPDDDNDSYLDENDAFPLDTTEWLDTDADGVGNNADPDDDGDGQLDTDEIACGSDPLLASSMSLDTDGDTIPDCVDTDDDNDGVLDTSDAFPLDPAEWTDTDQDGIGNNADTDDDNDGFTDLHELACDSDPLDRFNKPADQDNDLIPDCVDTDRDGDGYLNSDDVFPDDADEWVDTDGDGLGDNFEVDDDNDGYLDANDAFPLDPNEWADADNDGIGDNADPDDNNDGFEDDKIFTSGVLTPNSSGLESTWKIVNIDQYPQARVSVYDKNGLEVFSAQSYQNDWRGNYKNSTNLLPAGSYYYVVELNSGEEPITGWLYITY